MSAAFLLSAHRRVDRRARGVRDNAAWTRFVASALDAEERFYLLDLNVSDCDANPILSHPL